MTNWTIYTGSDEQIAEILREKNGYIVRHYDGTESLILNRDQYKHIVGKFTHYWIIPDDPPREMKIRQAHTGQPVWVRHRKAIFDQGTMTTTPDWNIPNAEYSFTHFEE